MTTVCPPDSVPDQRQRWCRRDVQCAVCYFLNFAQSNQIRQLSWSRDLNHGNNDSSLCSEIREYIFGSCNVFFYAKFNEMFTFVNVRQYGMTSSTSTLRHQVGGLRLIFTYEVAHPKITRVRVYLYGLLWKKWVAPFYLDTFLYLQFFSGGLKRSLA